MKNFAMLSSLYSFVDFSHFTCLLLPLFLVTEPFRMQHWHKLRKHNGERYAYTSHSQAVLDCLRNRNEWAQLVDRGPKVCFLNLFSDMNCHLIDFYSV